MRKNKHDSDWQIGSVRPAPKGLRGVMRKIKNWPIWMNIKYMKTWKKLLALLLIVILLGVGIIGTMAFSYLNNAVTEMQMPIAEDYDLSLTPVEGFINILLLGVDSRNMENIKGTRSDMIMIASINTETYDVTLTSVYRDTFLKLGDTSTYDKITHACVYGGPELTIKSLNQALDIDISTYALVNFKGVANIVDAVGGITVDVQPREINQLNKYTKQTARNIGQKEYNLVKAPGVQTLQGVQAVSYGRIRKGVGDDFKRTERMRIVVSKVVEKLKKMSFGDVKKIIDMMVPQVKTNLSMNDILALGVKLPKYNINSGSGWPYKWTSGYLNKTSYIFPSNLAVNAVEFHKQVFGNETYTASSLISSMSSEIASRISAARASNQLQGEKKGDSTGGKEPQTPEQPKDDDEDVNTDIDNPEVPTEPENPTTPTDPVDPENGGGTENPGGGNTGGDPSQGTSDGTGAGR